jgi:hypothetical protein
MCESNKLGLLVISVRLSVVVSGLLILVGGQVPVMGFWNKLLSQSVLAAANTLD